MVCCPSTVDGWRYALWSNSKQRYKNSPKDCDRRAPSQEGSETKKKWIKGIESRGKVRNRRILPTNNDRNLLVGVMIVNKAVSAGLVI